MIGCFVQGILSALPPETDEDHTRELSRALGARVIAAAQRLRLDYHTFLRTSAASLDNAPAAPPASPGR